MCGFFHPCDSQASVCVKIAGLVSLLKSRFTASLPRGSDLVSLDWNPEVLIPNKFFGHINSAASSGWAVLQSKNGETSP